MVSIAYMKFVISTKVKICLLVFLSLLPSTDCNETIVVADSMCFKQCF